MQVFFKRKRHGPDSWGRAPIRVVSPENDTPVPCFFWQKCRRMSEVEKGGKSVCRECAAGMRGQEYSLRTAREHRHVPIVTWNEDGEAP